jgi:hypothetical protein
MASAGPPGRLDNRGHSSLEVTVKTNETSCVAIHLPTLNAYLQKLRSVEGDPDATDKMANGRSEYEIRASAMNTLGAFRDATAKAGGFEALTAKLEKANYRRGGSVLSHTDIFDEEEVKALQSDIPVYNLVMAVSDLHTKYFGSGATDLGFQGPSQTGPTPPVDYDPEFAVRGGPVIIYP